MITCEVVANEYVLTTIAIEGLCNPDALTYCTKHLSQVAVLRFIVGAIDSIKSLALYYGTSLAGYHFRISIRIFQSSIAFLKFRHGAIFSISNFSGISASLVFLTIRIGSRAT